MTTSNEPTRPDRTTRATEAEDAQVQPGADQEPTPEEEAAAERAGGLDEDVSRTYEEAIERGAAQEGEGRLP